VKQVAEQNSSLNALVDKDVMKHGGCQLMLSPFVWGCIVVPMVKSHRKKTVCECQQNRQGGSASISIDDLFATALSQLPGTGSGNRCRPIKCLRTRCVCTCYVHVCQVLHEEAFFCYGWPCCHQCPLRAVGLASSNGWVGMNIDSALTRLTWPIDWQIRRPCA